MRLPCFASLPCSVMTRERGAVPLIVASWPAMWSVTTSVIRSARWRWVVVVVGQAVVVVLPPAVVVLPPAVVVLPPAVVVLPPAVVVLPPVVVVPPPGTVGRVIP